MNDPIRIVIADDHPVIRAGLRDLLASHGDFAPVSYPYGSAVVFTRTFKPS